MKWSLLKSNQSTQAFQNMLGFFMHTMGRGLGFWFRDWHDYQSAPIVNGAATEFVGASLGPNPAGAGPYTGPGVTADITWFETTLDEMIIGVQSTAGLVAGNQFTLSGLTVNPQYNTGNSQYNNPPSLTISVIGAGATGPYIQVNGSVSQPYISAAPETGVVTVGGGNAVPKLYQIIKTYNDGVSFETRKIAGFGMLPVGGQEVPAIPDAPLTIWVDGEQVPGTSWAFYNQSGLIYFTSGNEPAIGSVIMSNYSFTVPVRWDEDWFQGRLTEFDLLELPSMKLVELNIWR
jgi:hypothetical protein